MKDFLSKTLGGLKFSYYLRHFIFALALAALFIGLPLSQSHSLRWNVTLFVLVNTFLYPYARFVYESVVGYLMGDTVFAIPALIFLGVKFFTIVLCWCFAVFIAPVGLIYLYFHHTKAQKEHVEEAE